MSLVTIMRAAGWSLVTVLLLSPLSWGGEDEWRAEFERACSQSNRSMVMTVKELQELVTACDRVDKLLEVQDETVRKVYRKRVQQTKNLYLFMIETKKTEQQVPQK